MNQFAVIISSEVRSALSRWICDSVKAGGVVSLALGCAGCGLLAKRESDPQPLPIVAAARPLVEPAPLASTVTELPPPTTAEDIIPAACPPARNAAAPSPLWNRDAELEATADELRSLRDQSQQMQQRQSELSASLEQLTQDRNGDRERLTAIEAHLALQSTILEELKTASSQQQQETWRALDAVSEALDRILKEDHAIPPEPIAGAQSAPSISQEASQPVSSGKEIRR
jgi:hypothetical protein